LLQHHHLQRQE